MVDLGWLPEIPDIIREVLPSAQDEIKCLGDGVLTIETKFLVQLVCEQSQTGKIRAVEIILRRACLVISD